MTIALDRPYVETARRSRVIDWLCAHDHMTIGRRYIVTAFGFLLLGGLEALTMRTQLARPAQTLVGPDLYNQLFTVHGSTMMFLFAVPIMQGLGVYFVPLMIGARYTAFPRLLAFSFWMYLFGGLLLYAGLFSNTGPDAGWFAYVPLSGPQFSAGKRVDIWAQMITFTEIASLASSANLIVTIFHHRAPGMTLDRMPMFVWSQLVTSFMIIFAMPAVMIASSMLALDRLVATQFFNPAVGGDAILWQHLFWFFGHPEVYIIFLPAMGMVSTILAASTKRRLVGYTTLVLSLVATAILGFGLWVHHMFATGLPQLGDTFFTASSMLIAIPSGAQIFCWIASIWSGRPRMTTSFWFVLGFVAIFVIGGLTGIMLASVPIDIQVHDTFFVVAHLHYVLIGGAVFPLMGALYHWFPKITGRLLDERIGKLNFALLFVGFNVTFFPQHLLGLHGMPRRVYTYLPESGWNLWNLVSSLGSYVLGLGFALFVVNVVLSLKRGRVAGENPWDDASLEWGTSSPPARIAFPELPVVDDQYPLWGEPLGRVIGLPREEQLVTTLVEAKPHHRTKTPKETLWPFLASVAVSALIVACIFTPWGLVYGAIPVAITLVGWFWPRQLRAEKVEA